MAALRIGGFPRHPWFILADVCRVLEIANPRDAAARLDDDERNTVAITDGSRGNPTQTIINEPGLYRLILTSRKAQAKAFQKWVVSDVLPAIRKTGSCGAIGSPERQSGFRSWENVCVRRCAGRRSDSSIQIWTERVGRVGVPKTPIALRAPKEPRGAALPSQARLGQNAPKAPQRRSWRD